MSATNWKASPAFDTAGDLFLFACLLSPFALVAVAVWAVWRLARA